MLRKLIFITTAIFTLTSCTKEFSRVNVNPTAPSSVPLPYLFTQAQLEFGGSLNDPGYTQWRGNLIYPMTMMQIMAAAGPTSVYLGDKYLLTNTEASGYFGRSSDGEGTYPNSLKTLTQLIANAGVDSVTNVNIYSMAKILRAFQFQILTDMYGDCPYFQADLGYISGIQTPAYDKQQAIYADLLNQLSTAGAALDASKAVPSTADLIYGNLSGADEITAWKHFANSLMLRLAMRMQVVDPANAQTWAQKAITGGVMTSNTETFAIHYDGAGGVTSNPISYDLGPSTGSPQRNQVPEQLIQWGKTFISLLQTRSDPRLTQVAVINTVNSSNVITGTDTTAAHQQGLPNGLSTIPANIQAYSVPATPIYQANSPQFLLTYAEVEFLKAEAIERTYITGSAATEYQTGQIAALGQMMSFSPSYVPSGAAVAAYLTKNAYPSSDLNTNVNAIQTEMYILQGCTLNGQEAWASWRRTGFPVLVPVNFPGNASNGQIPRRLVYPTEEQQLNPTGYASAISDQGADAFTTHVWWDKGAAAVD